MVVEIELQMEFVNKIFLEVFPNLHLNLFVLLAEISISSSRIHLKSKDSFPLSLFFSRFKVENCSDLNISGERNQDEKNMVLNCSDVELRTRKILVQRHKKYQTRFHVCHLHLAKQCSVN